jgi:2-hydroxychromene-2-carboxylate isomerase
MCSPTLLRQFRRRGSFQDRMGNVIYLSEHRVKSSRPDPELPPAFFFDVSCPMSYLSAERIERTLGEVEWVPVDGASLRGDAVVRDRADACARELRLPLVWPDRFPNAARCAQRAASFACEIGAGPAFALAASRLAFCGGFDLEDPETLAEAAAAAGVPLDDCLKAAGESWRDEELEFAAATLRAHGVTELPAIRVGAQWFQGEAGLAAASAPLSESGPLPRRLAPVG